MISWTTVKEVVAESINRILEGVVVAIKYVAFSFVLVWSLIGFAQTSPLLFDTTRVEIDFLAGYYAQEGDHSPVTGGTGTEELSTVDNRLTVSFAPDSLHKITVNHKVNVITSASTDRIDGVSSASRKDAHTSISITYAQVNVEKRLTSSWRASLSSESDYASKGVGYTVEQVSRNGNHSTGMAVSAYFDDWVMIFPEELRADKEAFPTVDIRNSYVLSLHGTNILNRRTLFYWNLGSTFQKGLLSTPFHRVYFLDSPDSGLEVLPHDRLKFPVSIGASYFVSHNVILKLNYRFYYDSFGITSNTGALTSIFKISPFLSLSGALRYAQQNGTPYFREYALHSANDLLRTSDYDLSTFTSVYYNVGFSYAPLRGIGKVKGLFLDKLSMRFTHFSRSDGLQSRLISLGLKTHFDRI